MIQFFTFTQRAINSVHLRDVQKNYFLFVRNFYSDENGTKATNFLRRVSSREYYESSAVN